MNILRVDAYLFHSLFTTLLELSYGGTFITNIGHPPPPLFRLLLEDDHFPNFLVEDGPSAGTFLPDVLVRTILLSIVAVLSETERTELGVVDEFDIDEWADLFVVFLEVSDQFVGAAVV